jgi:hypothetical protein
MAFVSKIAASSSTLSVAVPLLAGVHAASEEDSVVVTTPRLPQLAHPDNSEERQQAQEASAETEEEGSVEGSKAVVAEEDSEVDLMVAVVEVISKVAVEEADSVADMVVEIVAGLAINKTASVELQTVHQQVLAVAVVEALVVVGIAIVHNSRNASVVPVAATANQWDHEEVDIATAMDLAAALEAETVVDATTHPGSAHTMETDMMAHAKSEGTDIVATAPFTPWIPWTSAADARFPFPFPVTILASWASLDWRCGCTSLLFPFPAQLWPHGHPWIGAIDPHRSLSYLLITQLLQDPASTLGLLPISTCSACLLLPTAAVTTNIALLAWSFVLL